MRICMAGASRSISLPQVWATNDAERCPRLGSVLESFAGAPRGPLDFVS